jgi:hypothetical protein
LAFDESPDCVLDECNGIHMIQLFNGIRLRRGGCPASGSPENGAQHSLLT